MNVEQKVNIHNKFEVHKDNIVTGEHTEYTGYNILLDSIYTRLCANLNYFTNIHFGTGTGIIDATRTSLFTHLGTKTAVNEELIRNIPVSSWKRKIVLNPEEYVGSEITEVGIAWGSTASYLMTHAFIKDSEGNQISIVKTNTDVITIYATVYITFDESNVKWISGASSSGYLLHYLVGGTVQYSPYFILEEIPFSDNPLASVPGVWVPDIPNKKLKTAVKRFGIAEGNGNILALQVQNNFIVPFPDTTVHNGQAYSDVAIGFGDGSTTRFAIPSRNLKSGTLVIKEDGVITNAVTEGVLNNIYKRMSSILFDGLLYIKTAHINSEGTRLLISYVERYNYKMKILMYKVDGSVLNPIGVPIEIAISPR